jgi:hypothetical protein
MEEKRENKRTVREYSKALGYTKRETECLVTLWTFESRFDHLARPRDSKGKPRFNWSVIILSVAFSIKAVAPEVMPVTLRLFNNSILKFKRSNCDFQTY